MAEDYDLICGRLPTGERCARPYGHSGRHMKVYVTKVETDYQDEWPDCVTCGHPISDEPEQHCPQADHPSGCGHHCNHIWSHDVCCWCELTARELTEDYIARIRNRR